MAMLLAAFAQAKYENSELPRNPNSVNSADGMDREAVCSVEAHLNVRDEDPERRAVSWCSIVQGLARVNQTAVRWCRPKLRSGFSRLEWFCCCGQHFWGDFEHTEHEPLDRLILGFHQNGFTVKVTTNPGATSTRSSNAHQQDITLTSRSSQTDLNKATSTAGARAPELGDPSATESQSAKVSFLAAGKPVYLELCVNRSLKITRLAKIMLVPARGEALINNDQQLFAQIRSKHTEHKRNGFCAFLYQPQDIHYVEFGYQVAARQTDIYQTPAAIPPREEVVEKRYHYFESPLKTLPSMPKQTFYQYFYRHERDCASRSILFCDRLPKKLGSSLTTTTGADQLAFGWGLHIIEGPNKPFLATLVAIILIVSFMVSVFYDVLAGNKESGFAIGQWVTGVLSAILPAVYFHFQKI
nr:hypothetical protein B0A51_06935 [Rachicladosporium sp. CCFEE 5018]